MTFRSEENTWGFGQWVPLIMLALPLFSSIEVWLEAQESAPRKYPRQESHGPQTLTLSSSPGSHQYYKYAWFQVLIWMLLILVCEIIIWATMKSQSRIASTGLLMIQVALAIVYTALAITIFTTFFVMCGKPCGSESKLPQPDCSQRENTRSRKAWSYVSWSLFLLFCTGLPLFSLNVDLSATSVLR